MTSIDPQSINSRTIAAARGAGFGAETPASDPISKQYDQRRHARLAEATNHAKRAEFWSWMRILAGLTAIGLWSWAFTHADVQPDWTALAGLIATVGFVYCVNRHRAARRATAWDRLRAHWNGEGIARRARHYDDLPPRIVAPELAQQALARDLDLFGKASLYRLICQAETPAGCARLAGWLVAPAAIEEIAPRQEAVHQLAKMLDHREALACRARQNQAAWPEAATFLEWAQGRHWLKDKQWLRAWAFALPMVWIAAIAGELGGWLPMGSWGVVLVVNMIITMFTLRPIHAIFAQVASREGELERYAELFDEVANQRVTAKLLSELQLELSAGGVTAHRQMQNLYRWITLAEMRYSPLVYMPLQSAFLWDVQVLAGVERWQNRFGNRVAGWFRALGHWEALASLASLAHDEPDWVTPSVDRAHTTVDARSLGHPLIAESHRISNDVVLGPAGSVLLVTGSNMSGKSTLLRAIGLNVVLAQAGSTVCARQLSMPRAPVATSMRIDDSLADGVSLFLAELQRLKQIVDLAGAARQSGDGPLIFLLDEILHGTNSHDRRIAVERVVGLLIAQGGLGAVTTHDLELARAPSLAGCCRLVHFRESVEEIDGRRQMTFDYHLRDGLATTTNALALLSLVGLDGEISDSTTRS